MRDEFDLPDDAPGRYIPLRPDADHHRAYYPDSLPPTVALDDELVELYGAAAHAVGRLDGVVSEVEDASAVFASFLYKEAEQSSRVEGTRVTVSDIVADNETDERDVQEAQNYLQALEDGIAYFQTAGRSREQLTVELIQQFHETLLASETAGSFRSELAFIQETTNLGQPSIRFVPPKPRMATSRMNDLEQYIQSAGAYPDLIDIALIHYQFETIHPFPDGNGRTGRLLVSVLLYCCGLLVNPVLYLSSFINRNRQEYTDRLLAVSERGEWKQWLMFFLDGVRQQAAEAFVRAKLLLEKRREYVERYEDDPRSVALLARRLFQRPFVTRSDAAELIEMTYQTGSSAVDQLASDGVLSRETDRQRGTVYRATEIMDIIERDAAMLPAPVEIAASDRGTPSV